MPPSTRIAAKFFREIQIDLTEAGEQLDLAGANSRCSKVASQLPFLVVSTLLDAARRAGWEKAGWFELRQGTQLIHKRSDQGLLIAERGGQSLQRPCQALQMHAAPHRNRVSLGALKQRCGLGDGAGRNQVDERGPQPTQSRPSIRRQQSKRITVTPVHHEGAREQAAKIGIIIGCLQAGNLLLDGGESS